MMLARRSIGVGLLHRRCSAGALALVHGLLTAATVAWGDAPGPTPTGTGSVPVTPIHASAWFVHGADATSKLVTLLVYFEGTPGWHAKATDFRFATSDTLSVIEMNVGATPIHVTYRATTRAVRILNREFTLDRDNVYLVSGIDGPAPVVKGAGLHDLAFGADDNPAIVLLARDAPVRYALIGEPPAGAAKGPVTPPPPADLTALDRQGIELLRKGGAENDRAACELFRKAVAADPSSAYQWLVVLLADPDVSAAKDRGPADELIRSVESRLDEGSRARAVATAHQFCRAYARRYIEKLGR